MTKQYEIDKKGQDKTRMTRQEKHQKGHPDCSATVHRPVVLCKLEQAQKIYIQVGWWFLDWALVVMPQGAQLHGAQTAIDLGRELRAVYQPNSPSVTPDIVVE